MADSVSPVVEDLLSTLCQWFIADEDASYTPRTKSEQCRDYVDSDQWTAEETALLNKRKQPIVTSNRIKPKVDSLLGAERQRRTLPKAVPRNVPFDELAGAAATDSIRYVLDNNNFDMLRSDVFENMLVEGYGGCTVEAVEKTDKRTDKTEFIIILQHILWDRIVYDSHSRKRDFSDARRMGQVIWMDYDEAQSQFPDIHEFDTIISASGGTSTSYDSSDGDTYGDKPWLRWIDPDRKRVRIVETWWKEGHGENQVVKFAKFTRAGIIETGESQYEDDEGNPVWPYEMASTFVSRDGSRYGHVLQLLSPQDEINKRRSKALHLINMRQIKYEAGAVDDISVARKEIAKPDGMIQVNPGSVFEILPTSDMVVGQLKLLEEAKREIDAIGANAAFSGKENRVMSGTALKNRENSGSREVEPIFDPLRMWQLNVYRKIWCCIKMFWKSPKWLRITDDTRNIKFVGINTDEKMQMAAQEMEGGGESPVSGMVGNLGELDVDITLDEAPDSESKRAEQFQMLMQMRQAQFQIPDKAIIEVSDLRDKDKLLESMKPAPEELQAEQEMTAIHMDQEMKKREIENEKLLAEVRKTVATAMKLEMETAMHSITPPPGFGRKSEEDDAQSVESREPA